jgi:hypothetical protein
MRRGYLFIKDFYPTFRSNKKGLNLGLSLLRDVAIA